MYVLRLYDGSIGGREFVMSLCTREVFIPSVHRDAFSFQPLVMYVMYMCDIDSVIAIPYCSHKILIESNPIFVLFLLAPTSAPTVGQGGLEWKYLTGPAVITVHSSGSTPVFSSDGTIYVGSTGTNFYALSSTGALKWTFVTGNSPVASSPVMDNDGILYFGSCDGYLYAITSAGALQWKFKTGGCIYSAPALGADGTVYVGSYDTKVYAITPPGTVKWTITGNRAFRTSPAIGSDGTVYCSCNDGNLYAVSSTGTVKWKFGVSAAVVSSPALGADGTIYVG